MSRIIAIANQKGGVGKTTTSINLSACLAEAGQKTLVVDMDPQGNTTSGFNINKYGVEKTVYNLLLGQASFEDCVIRDAVKGIKDLSILPSNVNLAGAEIELLDMEDRFHRLKNELDKVRDNYDFILIDCPPSLSALTLNALTAADTVLITIQCEYLALEGLNDLMNTIRLVQNRTNPTLEMEGAVFTMFDARTNLSLQVVENVKANLKNSTYKTIIPRNVKLAEAPSHGLPIILYDSKSAGAESYRLLAEEVIHRGEEDYY